jgi:hypothetical protein
LLTLAVDSLIRLCVTDGVKDHILRSDCLEYVLAVWPRATDVVQLSIIALLIKLADHHRMADAITNSSGLDILISLGNTTLTL